MCSEQLITIIVKYSSLTDDRNYYTFFYKYVIYNGALKSFFMQLNILIVCFIKIYTGP